MPIYTWVRFRIRLAHYPKYKNNYILKNGLAYCEIALRNRTCKQALRLVYDAGIDIEKLQNRLLKVCYVPATSASFNRRLFFLYLFLLRPLTVQMNQTRQAVRAIEQSIYLDVYGCGPGNEALSPTKELGCH
jgi:hypothetical protein